MTSPTSLDDARWRKSSYSSPNGSDCVEVAPVVEIIAVRDSKNPHGPKLTFVPQVWAAFTGRIRVGEFDL